MPLLLESHIEEALVSVGNLDINLHVSKGVVDPTPKVYREL